MGGGCNTLVGSCKLPGEFCITLDTGGGCNTLVGDCIAGEFCITPDTGKVGRSGVCGLESNGCEMPDCITLDTGGCTGRLSGGTCIGTGAWGEIDGAAVAGTDSGLKPGTLTCTGTLELLMVVGSASIAVELADGFAPVGVETTGVETTGDLAGTTPAFAGCTTTGACLGEAGSTFTVG